MAMKETRTEKVAPQWEEYILNVYRSFGWDVIASQDVHTQDVKREGDDIVTITTDYVKITFERNTSRQHYQELQALENEYYAIYPYYFAQPKFFTKLWLILIGIGLIAYVVPGIALLIVHIILHKKNIEKWNIANAKREEILQKAQALV